MGTKKGMVRKTARKAYVKKAGYGKTMKAKSGLKKPGKTQKGLKALPTAVRNKMGFAKHGTKKGMARKTARKAYMKKGGSTRKCKSGCK
jgi:hypothetical protein|tara:strand:+ start:8125 stop:8391 length:267 start_codon:yes stop_codon:yes gene_type:complete